MTPDRPTRLTTRHGELMMPAFLPDATRAGVRSVTSDDLRAVGIPAIVVNAFHLMRRPGVRVIQAAGGVHKFMDWDGPILSDSGGFQVYSLIRQNPDYGVIRANEVIFREPGTSEKWTLTPEKVVQIQFQLGSDIVVCLDDCTDAGDDLSEQARSVERTIRWARRCKQEFERLVSQQKRDDRPLLFAVVQGGASEELRRECARALVEIGFDGFGFGGWPLTEDGELLTDVLRWVVDALPAVGAEARARDRQPGARRSSPRARLHDVRLQPANPRRAPQPALRLPAGLPGQRPQSGRCLSLDRLHPRHEVPQRPRADRPHLRLSRLPEV